ncbi:MAG: c-type cytochrome [Planctomycetes bacterium]|nr:c-type cytochrome [Planctomycetota bacterium]
MIVRWFLVGLIAAVVWAPPVSAQPDASVDAGLRIVPIDSDAKESFLSVRVDTMGRLFVGGREGLFVYEPNAQGGYQPRKLLYRFPAHSWVYDIEIRGNDLYVLTLSALYLFPDAVSKRENLRPRKLIWGVPLGHVHQCFHSLAWGPEGDLYISMGDPLWYYGDFNRPDHWGHWTFFSQPWRPSQPLTPGPSPTRGEGSKIPYNGVGGVFRCKPDGSGFQVVARGLRNSCGLAFDRHWNLFSNDNDHEGLPALYVPGRLVHVTPHAYFSWPRGWMVHKAPDRADLLQTMFDGMGRAVPVGQSYYDETFLPEKYRHNLLIARWGIRALTRYPLEPRGASFKATEHGLLQGKNLVRPVGVSVGRGGRIFATIAHMAHNEGSPIYKSDLVMITRKDDPKSHPFAAYDAVTAPPAKLWQELSDSSWQRRYRAHIELTRRGGDLLKQANKRLFDARPSDPALHSLIWLAARSQQGSLHLLGLLGDADPRIRAQTIRALTEFPEQMRGETLFNKALHDKNLQVQHAAVSAFFSPKIAWNAAIRLAIERGPACSKDTYLRQAATLLLAKKATRQQLEALCESVDEPLRLAGVLAIGSRLTIPPIDKKLPSNLPLARLREESAYVIEYADGKVDLRKHGRVGNYTVAEHWKADMHSEEQELLFKRLRLMLKDRKEPIRLQAAFYLSLLNDPRSEPEVAKIRIASEDRRLATAPIQAIKEVWAIGPFHDGKAGFKKVHAPERGPIDLTADYTERKKLRWQVVKPGSRHYVFSDVFGPCEQSSFYAHTRLESATRQKVHLLVGSDDGVKVWHNGTLVFTNAVSRGALPFQDVVPLELQPGSNDLLVRVNNLTGECAMYLHVRHRLPVVPTLPEKISTATLAERLKSADKNVAIGKEFLSVDWNEAVKKGDAKKGRQLFESLACAKCHGISSTSAVAGGPSLADAKKRFTIPYLVESILLPGKQISPVFRATYLELKSGKVLTGLVVNETAEKLEVLLPDAMRSSVPVKQIEVRRLVNVSPMPAGVVRRPEELRDLLAFLLKE